MFESWRDFYQSDLQGLYLVCVAPILFFVFLLVRGAPERGGARHDARRFVHVYALVFCIETILDPFATGPLARWLGLAEPFATLWVLPFVLLGDFRVFVLLFFLARPRDGGIATLQRAGRWTLVVPLFAWTTDTALGFFFPARPPQSVWIAYELGFLAMALYLAIRWAPATVPPNRPELRGYLVSLALYAALYYALWAASDLIVIGGSDLGWALRVVPNQLYYSFWVPFAYTRFFSRRYDSTSRPAHASR